MLTANSSSPAGNTLQVTSRLPLEKGEVDAVADSEPIGTLLLANGKVRNVVDQATDSPYKDEYCCAVVVNGKFLANNPTAAAAATSGSSPRRSTIRARAAGRSSCPTATT